MGTLGGYWLGKRRGAKRAYEDLEYELEYFLKQSKNATPEECAEIFDQLYREFMGEDRRDG